MVRGLEGLPAQGGGPDGRPTLYVGNHTTLALDMGVMIEELLREKGLLLRGLAHPIIFGQGSTAAAATDGEQQGRAGGPGEAKQARSSQGPSGFEAFMTEFGAVPVGGRNFHKLLSNGEAVLLFPGGVREAYKKRGEAYQLFWPEGRDEFVRMAAKHGGRIVPFACVGPEDSLTLVADADELASLPFGVGAAIDARARAAAGRVRPARAGVNADPELEEGRFLAPLVLPGAPDRMYFAFREAIELDAGLVKDREAAAAMYKHVKAEVEGAISWLKAGRERDAFRGVGARVVREAVSGGQAPSFEP